MAWLQIIYNPRDEPLQFRGPNDIKLASLPIPDNMDTLDIYEVARKLAELLLENIP